LGSSPPLIVEGGLDAAAIPLQDSPLVADLGEHEGASDVEAALRVVGGAVLGAAKADVLGGEGGGDPEQAAGAGVVRDGHAVDQEVLEALRGDL
jgi:hypothetical protein